MRFTTVSLQQAAPAVRKRPGRHAGLLSGKRTHITSEKLCDDVLQLLKPSLPPPHTCDLIDLNPGQCLWSRKLHDLLKPRRHILVEPRREVFANFIEPLLAIPDTPYRYAENIHRALDREEGLLSAETYQFRTRLEKSSGQQYAINDRLLLTANLSGTARVAVGFTGSEAKQVLNDYYRSTFVREDFIHRYGLVRLLAWAGEDSRRSIMPTTVISRTKQSIQLETTCEVEEVASPSPFDVLHTHQSRWHELDVENQIEVRKSQEQLGLPIPVSRWQPNPIPPFTSLQPNIDAVRKNKDIYPHHQLYIRRMLDLDNKILLEDPVWYAEYLEDVDRQFEGVKSNRRKKSADPPEKTAYRTFMNQLRTHHNTYLKAHDVIWEQRRLFRKFQLAYQQGSFSDETGSSKVSDKTKADKLIKEDEILQEQCQQIKFATRANIIKASDDYRCFDADHRIMSWNRRRFDPLLVRKTEFIPHKPLTLFDFRPKLGTPVVLDTVDKQICFDYVCTTLMMNPGESVMEGLKRLVPAGHEIFLEALPQLRDVTKGGWWNLNNIRIRTLHHDFFVAIALAFCDWPLRPPIGHLMNVYKGVFDEGPK